MADTPTLSEIQDAIIQSGAEWEAAENPISQLSENEQRLVLGLQPPLGEPTLDEFAAMPPLLGAPATPSKYDLRNVNGKNYITAIRDQSTCGSCVAFGCLLGLLTKVVFLIHHMISLAICVVTGRKDLRR